MNRLSLLFCAALLAALPSAAATPRVDGVVLPIGAASQLIIPAAGSVAGANGTFFRSDITVINFADHAQRVELRWVPRAGGSGTTGTLSIPAQTGIGSEDFVTMVLGQQGLGSIIVTGLADAGDALDTSAKLFASARIWTNEPGSIGTVSQSFDVVPPPTASISRMAIFGIRRDTHYRANVGVVNLDPVNAHTFVIDVATQPAVPGGEEYEVTVPPMSMQQISLVAGTSPLTQVTIVRSEGPSSLWLAYGSSVDNITGDSWSELPIPSQ